MSNQKPTSQSQLILSYYESKPNVDIPHAEMVPHVTAEWLKLTGKPLADPDRAVRKLHQNGNLIKVRKGVYRYDPDHRVKRTLEDFSASQKQQILERDGYKCVVCGKGVQDGVELQIDHKKAKDLDGKATVDNGQTLCAKHNFLKKNFDQTELGKKLFIDLYKTAKRESDQPMISFTSSVLSEYEAHGVDDHIVWNR